MKAEKIRVLLIDDSPVALAVIQKVLASDRDIEVVASFLDPQKALAQIAEINPDVICVDFFMKHMDGLEFTKTVMSQFPCPILVISVAVGMDDGHNVFELLNAGAVDVIKKPPSGHFKDYLKTELVQKVKIASGVRVLTRRPISENMSHFTSTDNKKFQVIAIGASTGGPKALHDILSVLPKHFSIPIVVSQHITSGFLSGLIRWMGRCCALKVQMAVDQEPLLGGHVYFCPEESNLLLTQNRTIALQPKTMNQVYCPSINTMFHSAAEHYGSRAIGILLTGMGDDGAMGMKYLHAKGGLTIAQNEASCVLYGMPRAAVELNAVRKVMDIAEIGSYLRRLAAQPFAG